jgi:hypothetical protein
LHDQAGSHWVPFYVVTDLLELPLVAGDPVEVFVLPERACSSQESIHTQRSRALDLPDESRKRNLRCPDQVDVIRHDDVRVQQTVTGCGDLAQLLEHKGGNLRLAKIQGTAAGVIEESIESDESFSRSKVFALENAFRRQASPEPPRDKDRNTNCIQMGQATAVDFHCSRVVS